MDITFEATIINVNVFDATLETDPKDGTPTKFADQAYVQVKALSTDGHILTFPTGVVVKGTDYPISERGTVLGDMPFTEGDTITITIKKGK